jgi:hypothetical protein
LKRLGWLFVFVFLFPGIWVDMIHPQTPSPKAGKSAIPKTWDDAEMAALEIPLANPKGSPKQVSADYYYRVPVRPIYKSYPVYAAGHEPTGYLESLKHKDPIIYWDDKGHAPRLETEADWINAGEAVFDAPISDGGIGGSESTDLYVRDSKFPEMTGALIAKDGTLPYFRYVVKKKGEVEIGILACGMCHTRVMPDGTVLKGAQGNFPLDRYFAFDYLRSGAKVAPVLERSLYATPWITSDPLPSTSSMPLEQIAEVHRTIPPGVVARHRTSPFAPAQVPDLIGVKDRKYLDRTGLQQQHSIVDLMRYAALNQGGDDLANFNGFVPVDFPDFKQLPKIEDLDRDRYSDEQLYALARYIYSLKPPPNPNKFDLLAERGQKVFRRENCNMCHTPPLYTNNKLTIATGFTPSADAERKYDILPLSVGTEPNLTLKTRRGTGYYKVPSLRGVWYRGMFGHSGWCATLEDWFDPRRLRDDYVPTGFKPYGKKTYAVQGHPFGLDLSAEDRRALIAFLKTL